jgi:hypothetical protein
MASRYDNDGRLVAGVWQYIPIVTDGVLVVLGTLALLSIVIAFRELYIRTDNSG